MFRRASKNHVLCDDAKAFAAEARRRVKRFRDAAEIVSDGDRILILGEDVDGKTDDLTAILIRVDQTITKVNGAYDGTFSACLLAPLPSSDDESDEDVLSVRDYDAAVRRTLGFRLDGVLVAVRP